MGLAGIVLALFGLCLALFHPVLGFGFVNFDDGLYVAQNPFTASGLTFSGLRWAFTRFHGGNWYPLTLLSHMWDVQIYGLNPAGHHLSNILLHAANVLILFAVLRRLSGDCWRAALAAAIFAVHPLQVETVAWVSQRKTLLSFFFCLNGVWAYSRWAQTRTKGFFAALLAVFAAALMSKATAVTLPVFLLILDFWPLRRPEPLSRLILEKTWLWLMSLAAGFAALAGAAGVSWQALPPAARLGHAALSYAAYFREFFWPAGLCVYYPYPASLDLSRALAAALAGLALGSGAWRSRERRPWLWAGWLWFLAALLPMIGLSQVGGQARADHYMYPALPGLAAALAFSLPLSRLALIPAAAMVIGCSAASSAQLRHWRDSVSLFERALSVDEGDFLAHNNLGFALLQGGKTRQARIHFERALELLPTYADARTNLGICLALEGDAARARREFEAVLRAEPRSPGARLNLEMLGKLEKLGKSQGLDRHRHPEAPSDADRGYASP
ncbi:MAG: tetratricopeptide repeat protein [Elusimicrobia bacterium]|nr:tetratricopeptide repeat protein [Elusimicrobiota bacterium]